jgi:hypothetical protein
MKRFYEALQKLVNEMDLMSEDPLFGLEEIPKD